MAHHPRPARRPGAAAAAPALAAVSAPAGRSTNRPGFGCRRAVTEVPRRIWANRDLARLYRRRIAELRP